ncbi:MAG TPA: hypothetical protein VGD74_11360, partial [Vulgatibacter sp.]
RRAALAAMVETSPANAGTAGEQTARPGIGGDTAGYPGGPPAFAGSIPEVAIELAGVSEEDDDLDLPELFFDQELGAGHGDAIHVEQTVQGDAAALENHDVAAVEVELDVPEPLPLEAGSDMPAPIPLGDGRVVAEPLPLEAGSDVPAPIPLGAGSVVLEPLPLQAGSEGFRAEASNPAPEAIALDAPLAAEAGAAYFGGGEVPAEPEAHGTSRSIPSGAVPFARVAPPPTAPAQAGPRGSDGNLLDPAAIPARFDDARRVVIHLRSGASIRGELRGGDLHSGSIHLHHASGADSIEAGAIKAIFFMRDAQATAPRPAGVRVRLTLSDGRTIEGFAPRTLPPAGGFFVLPSDGRTNTAWIFVYPHAIRDLAFA